MSFIQDFYESSVGHVAAYAFAAVAAMTTLSGCDATLPKRVAVDSVVRGTLPARQELRREVAGSVRLTACPTEDTTAPAKPGLLGALEKAIMPTTRVTIGDPTCGQNQQRIDQNGVAPRPTR